MAAVAALGVLVATLLFPRIETLYVQRALVEGTTTLRLVADAIDQAVGRFDPIPTLIAGDPVLVDLLKNAPNQGVVPFVNEKLRLTARSIGVSDVYVMDRTGQTVAASNYRGPASFVGRNFSYRPYFQRALGGDTAQFHALGTTSGERGFFFSAPILDGIDVIGVLAVKVTVDTIEAAWEEADRDIIVTDGHGVAFLASRPEHRLRSLAPLPDGVRARIADTRQFPLNTITPIPFLANVIAPGAVEVRLGLHHQSARYLSKSQPLDMAGWHAILLIPFGPVRNQAIAILFTWSLAAITTALFGLLLYQRRARLLEKVRVEQTQNTLLEKAVRDRTEDLRATNANLRSEIADRKSAEDRLRKTQMELVQAGKLAALGQMSAALSHEINQPLAATKSYADNAAQYLKRNRLEEVGTNIKHISEMTDRMASISRHLRNFARQPSEKLRVISVRDVIGEAMALVEPKRKQMGAKMVFAPAGDDLWVLGGHLRLQQVLINILNNALDAMQDSPDPVIEIDTKASETSVTISVRDHGPGLPPHTLDQVFDAFYTTKASGAGMGLGMSISHNIVSDFGGTLSAQNHVEGGAVFAVALQRRDRPSEPQTEAGRT